MKHTTSRRIGANEKTYYDVNLINQAYGSDGVKFPTIDFNLNLLQGFYGSKAETIIFYDMERERLKKSVKDKEEELRQ